MFRRTRPSGRSNLRPSVLNRLALGAVVACAFAAFGAQGAGATTCPKAECFNYGVLDAGGSAANIITPSNQLAVTPTLTGGGPTTYTYEITPSNASFPTYNFTADGFNGTINTSLKNNATGTLDFATGAITMTGDFIANVTLQGESGSCNLDTGTVNMSTGNAQPLMGVAFPAGASGITAGAGSFGGTWSSVTATPVPSDSSVCTLLSVAGYTGPGGLWVSRNLAPPSPTVKVGKLKAVKAGKSESIHVKLANGAGTVGTGAIKLCLKVPKGLKVNKKCQTVSNVAAGKTDVVTFKVKTAKPKHKTKKTKTYKLTLTPSTTTDGLMSSKALAAQTIKFRVKG
jgi:hypothetical protein